MFNSFYNEFLKLPAAMIPLDKINQLILTVFVQILFIAIWSQNYKY